MTRPTIVATPDGVAALRPRFAEECRLAPARSLDACLERLESARKDNAEVLLVLLDADWEVDAAAIAELRSSAPGAALAVAGEDAVPSIPETIVLPRSGAGLDSLVALLLERRSLARSAAEARRQLELVSSAGVAVASSFDIVAILERTREAARELLGGGDVALFYGGWPAINARPRWFPESPQLPSPARRRLERLAVTAEAPCRSDALLFVPMVHQNEGLGALVCDTPGPVPTELVKLLAVLGLQAATALGNIHSAQERIQFERLSTIGRMIGSIVHDFRSPLTALRGYGGMLLRLDLEPSERRELASALLEECDRLNHMAEDLLDFTRGRTPSLEREWTRLGPYLAAQADRARRHYGDRGIAVELDVGRVGEIRIDRERFGRALWNVIANGCQSMSSKGGRLNVRSSARDGRVVIEVEDEGEGIPEDIRHRIFEPFFSSGKSEGIGLGMSTAKRIAEEHDAEIEVESERGRGTRVRFSLPLEPREAASEVVLPAMNRAKR